MGDIDMLLNACPLLSYFSMESCLHTAHVTWSDPRLMTGAKFVLKPCKISLVVLIKRKFMWIDSDSLSHAAVTFLCYTHVLMWYHWYQVMRLETMQHSLSLVKKTFVLQAQLWEKLLIYLAWLTINTHKFSIHFLGFI